MRILLILLLLLASCNVNRSARVVNEKATCMAECYERCGKTCDKTFITARFLGYSPEEYMICECLVQTDVDVVDGKATPVLKSVGVVLRKPKAKASK